MIARLRALFRRRPCQRMYAPHYLALHIRRATEPGVLS